jgi:hypothetical protein
MGIGYQGYAKLSGTIVLVTGGGVDLVQDPIYSSSAWGAGWKNIAPSAHYADTATRYEGTVDFELQLGVWTTLRNWVVDNRITPITLELCPDGSKIFTYTAGSAAGITGAYNTSTSFSTSEGSVIGVSVGIMSFDRSVSDGDTYIDNKTGLIADNCTNLVNPINPSCTNLNPVPYWKSTAEILVSSISPQAGLQAVEWNVDITQNTLAVYTCRKSKLPRAVLQGSMDITGSVIMYHPDGVFDPISDATMGGYNTSFRVKINGGAATITIPAVIVESDAYDISGLDSVTNRTFNMKGMGGSTSSSPLMLT